MSIVQKIKYWLQRPAKQKAFSIVENIYKYKGAIEARLKLYDFDGYIPCRSFKDVPFESLGNATAYHGYSIFYLKVLMNEALKHQSFEHFVDVGSGKGKVCINAAKYFSRPCKTSATRMNAGFICQNMYTDSLKKRYSSR